MFARLKLFQKTLQNNDSNRFSKQRGLDADPKAIQQINFTRNLDGNNNRLMFSVIEEAKKTILNFSQGTVKVL